MTNTVDLGGATHPWTDRSAHPWRRFFARVFDNLLVGSALWLALAVVGYAIAPAFSDQVFEVLATPLGGLLDGMLTLVFMIPVSAVLIGLSGGSPGKWIFGVRVSDGSGRPIGFFRALTREAKVWFFGLGAGIPIVTLFTLSSSRSRLEETGKARWDRKTDIVITHRTENIWQRCLTFVGAAVVVTSAVGLKVLSYLPS